MNFHSQNHLAGMWAGKPTKSLLFAFRIPFLTLLLVLGFASAHAQCLPRSSFFYGEMVPNNGCGTFANYTSFGPGEYFRMPVLQGGSYRISTCGNNIDTQITGFQGNVTNTSIFYNDDSGPDCGSSLQASVDFVPNFTDYTRVEVSQYNCQPGGTASITVKVRQNNNLNFTTSAANMCQGQVRGLNATPARILVTPQPNSGNVGTFSGTGVSGNVFTAPTPAGASGNYTLTYTFGYCSTTQSITVFRLPSAASAGPDQTVCASSATLAANSPGIGSGNWTVVSGPGTVTSPGSPNSTVTGLSSATPTTLRWTISNGPCTVNTDDVVITRTPAPSSSNAGPDQTVCAATATLAANTPAVGNGTWTLVGGSGTITSPNSPTSTVTGLGTGPNTFRWAITNGVCPSSTDDVVITRTAAPSASNAGPDQTICAATATLAANTPAIGTGTWTLVGGSGTITSPNSPTSTLTGLGVGANTFRWSITNGACPSSTDDVVITRTAAPSASNAGPDQTICAATATLAANTPAIGTGTWTLVSGSGTITSPNSPTSTLTGLGVGANTFRWSIANGVCPSSTDDVVITVDESPTASNAGPDQTICAATAILAANTPAVGTGTWTLVGGSGTITSPNSPTSSLTGLGVGANTFRWSIANGVCPSSTDDVVITVDESPTASSAGPDQTICGSTATLAANTPAVGTGTWTLVGGSGTITNPNSPTSTLTGLGTGANTFRWSITNGVCPSSTDDVVITVDASPTASSAGPDQSICADSTSLAGNAPSVGSGQWTLVGGSGSITAPASPGSGLTGLGTGANTFVWTISNGVCPPTSDTVMITVFDDPSVSAAGPDQTTCDTTVVLNANAPTTGSGSWSLVGGSGTFTSPNSPTTTVTGLGIGANTYRWTIMNGPCTASTDDVVITRNALPSNPVVTGNLSICEGSSTSLTATSGANGASFSWWDSPSGGNSLSTTAAFNTGSLTATSQYWVEVTDSITGCTSNRTLATVVVNPLPAAPVSGGDLAICNGDTIPALSASVLSGQIVNWFAAASGGTSLSTGSSFTPTTSGTFYAEASDSASGCPSATRTPVTLTIHPLPAVSLGGNQSICPGSQACLDAGPGFSSYLWSNGDTTQTICVTAPMLYTVTVTDSNGCQGMDNALVSAISAGIVAGIGIDTSACPSIDFSDQSSVTSALTWAWDFGDGNSSTSANPTHSYATSGNGSYTVTLIVTDSCGADTTTQTVDISCIVGIGEGLTSAEIQVYPNPNMGRFKVTARGIFADQLAVRLTDLSGKSIYQQSFRDVNGEFALDLDLGEVAKGVYFLILHDGARQFTRKVVIQ